ncbi:putative WAT1-related protein [Sesbania bispinosa]|nr:putative WAT1-related protein [Sesbania bispinosa]
MENLRLQTLAGKAKTVGAILCVGGALVTSLYKGKEFYLGHREHQANKTSNVPHETNMLRGTIFLILSCCSYTAWFIVQDHLNTEKQSYYDYE